MGHLSPRTFIVYCPWCKAKVAALEKGRAKREGFTEEDREPFAYIVLIGTCPSCEEILVGETHQIDFEGYAADEDRWSDVIRVYPKPPKSFSSRRIPRVVRQSLDEADRCLQVGAYTAACVMLGRALEALCRDIIKSKSKTKDPVDSSKEITLSEGIEKLKDDKIIDDRLYEWSQQLRVFRNLAAHPEEADISREDAGDLQSFVVAIVEYVYDLADRYEEFKRRSQRKESQQKAASDGWSSLIE